MEVSVQDKEKYLKELEIVIPEEEVSKRIQESYNKIKKDAFVPGFRKGKVPLVILKSHFRKAVESEVEEKMMEEFYPKAIEKEDLQVVGEPKFEDMDFSEGKPFKFKVIVETIPPIELGEYKNMEVEVEKIEVTDEDVEAVIEMKREEAANLKSTDRPAIKGDVIVLDVTIEKDGKVLQKAKEIKITLGEKVLPKEVEDKIAGMKKGESKKISVKEEELDYTVEIKDVLEKRLIEIDKNFLKTLGEFKNLDELKKGIRENLENIARRREEKLIEDKILGKIIENSKVEIPPTLVENVIKYYKVKNEKAKEIATQELKKTLIIKEIAKREDLKVTDEELESERQKIMEEGTTEEKREWLPDKKKEDLRNSLLHEKVVDFLKKNVKTRAKKKLILTPEEARAFSQKKGEVWKKGKGIIIPS